MDTPEGLTPNAETVDAMRAARAGETSAVTLGELQAGIDLDDEDSPEVTALRAAIRAALLAGESFSSLKDILATEDALLERECEAAGVPPPPSFDEQMADPGAFERHRALMRELISKYDEQVNLAKLEALKAAIAEGLASGIAPDGSRERLHQQIREGAAAKEGSKPHGH